jgi:putative membrane protein
MAENDDIDNETIREHLANERTFLAWTRTALAMIGLGFIVAKFSLFVREIESVLNLTGRKTVSSPVYSLPMGILLIGLALVLLIASYIRYLRIERQISQRKFANSGLLIKLATIILVTSIVFLILYLYLTTA